MQELKELELKLRQEYAPHRGWSIRLIENALGGASVALLIYSVYTVFTSQYTLNDWQIYILFGLIAFSLVNMIRFLRDEIISIPYLFYRLGVLSKDMEINNLKNQLAQLQTNYTSTKQIDTATTTAQKIIKLYYAGHDIDRSSCVAHGIRENEWNLARDLLAKAGIVNANKSKRTEFNDITYTQAKQKLMEYTNA